MDRSCANIICISVGPIVSFGYCCLCWGCRARWESVSYAMHLNSGVAFSNSDGEIGVGGSPWKKR